MMEDVSGIGDNNNDGAPSSAPPPLLGGGDDEPDPNPKGMERLPGETDEEYIARQTRLRAEAKARMQQQVQRGDSFAEDQPAAPSGSPSHDANTNIAGGNGNGNGGGYGLVDDVDAVVNRVSGALSAGLSLVESAVPNDDEIVEAFSSGLSKLSSAVDEVVGDETVSQIKSVGGSLASTATSYGGSFWNSLVSTVDEVALSVTPQNPDESLAALQRKYEGSSSSTAAGTTNDATPASISKDDESNPPTEGGTPPQQQPSTLETALAPPATDGGGDEVAAGVVPPGEAPGLPGEDRNGVERLTGETDEQYELRQARIRNEARAREAAAGSGDTPSPPGNAIAEPAVVRL